MNQTKSTSKKLLALLLALIMTVSLLPVSVFAEELATGEVAQEEVIDLTGGQQDASQPGDGEEAAEPVEEPVQESADTYAATDENAVEAATTINYVEKKQSVPLPSAGDMGYRIVHIDCGRKYFSFDDLKKIIDYAAENNYTHVELAFGNDGLRFLLNDMEVTASGVTYASEKVTSAIKAGNVEFGSAGELTESEMGNLISYAKGSGIGIIPMFDAPGHLYAVITAMQKLGLNPQYRTPTKSSNSWNWAIKPTDAASVNFVQALMQKYISYFKSQGCTMFNFAADECGITDTKVDEVTQTGMTDAEYTAYAKMVNSMAAMVQNTGMTALAFNDGIYHPKKNLSEGMKFDSDIAICYWDAGGGTNYVQASELVAKGHQIINTHNKWYYVLGSEGSSWFGYQWAQSYMNGECKDCRKVDGGYTTDTGCMNALWCDNPDAKINWENVESHIKLLANNNSDYFKAPETPKEPVLTMDKENVVVGDTVTFTLENYTGEANGINWTSSAADVLELNTAARANNSVTAKALKEGDATVTAAVEGGNTYTQSVTVTEQQLEQRTITVTVGGTATDTIEGVDYSGETFTPDPTGIATVSVTGGTATENTCDVITKPTDITSGDRYLISNNRFNSGNNVLTETKTTYTVGSGSYATTFTGCQLANTSGSDIANNTNWWTITEENGQYYVQYNGGNYLSVTNNTSSTITSKNLVTLNYNAIGKYWTIYQNGYYMNNLGAAESNVAGGWNGNGAATDGGSQWTIRKIVPAGERTNITFTGVAEGTTYVTIGNVQYTINVVPKEVAEAGTLPIQLWITNNVIQATETSGTTSGIDWGGDNTSTGYTLGKAQYFALPATTSDEGSSVYSAEGMYLADAFTAAGIEGNGILSRYEWGGTRFVKNPAGDDRPTQNLVFWTGRIHTETDKNIQKILEEDYSNSGEEFRYVRYWQVDTTYQWQVSADRVNWTNVTGGGSTGSYSSCTEQLAAYYMIRTEITKAVTTDVADWGPQKDKNVDPDGTTYDQQVGTNKNFVLLDFAVKYADGTTRDPDSFPVDNKTLAYHCDYSDTNSAVGKDGSDTYRKLNNFRGVETNNYEVIMITVTMTDDSKNEKLTTDQAKNGYTYDGQEKIIWALDQATYDTYAKSESNPNGLEDYVSISDNGDYNGHKLGGDAYVRGIEVYNKHGALITYYVREKEQADNLTVEYYVQGETKPFYSYQIVVSQNTTFDEDFARTEKPLGLTGNTVKNIDNVTQTVEWDLTKIRAVPAAYRYVDYEFVAAKRETDGKTVKLYYTITAEKTFVVDFGLPLTITPADVNNRLGGEGVTIEEVKMGRADAAPGDYSTLSCTTDYANITRDSCNVIYTLNKPLDKEDTFGLQYTGTLRTTEEGKETTQPGSTARYTITIIPAANVYYEDSFVTFTPGTDESGNPVEWSAVGSEKKATQALEVLGDDAAARNVYGYDPAYDSCTTFSMDSAMKVTVNASVTTNPTAQFTFKGTGFDVISLTDNQSGAIMVKVYKETDTTQKPVKSHFVNNYYGYTYTEETGWVVDTDKEKGSNALYQIPVMKVTGLDYGEYTVVITAAYSSIFDTAGAGQYSFWLDAIRVYDPMGPDADGKYYQQDGEGWAQYIRLRNELAGKTADIDADAEGNKALFIDGKENAGLEDYTHYGPNNEVYLLSGQAISFKLLTNASIQSVQIGAKAPMDGKSAVMQVNKQQVGPTDENGDVEAITTATEMYYDITTLANNGQVTITNTGDGILSLTNLKITFTSKPQEENKVTLAKLTDEEKENAVQAVRALFAAPVEPDPEPFTPERFETSWSRDTVKVGQKATLTVKTSEDVEAITVNGETVTAYRTRTQRTGWGWNAKKVTYREFTYTITANEAGTLNYSVAAVNAENVASEPITATLTVQAAAQRPGWGGWLGNLFGRWF